jgi:hypothetical protein
MEQYEAYVHIVDSSIERIWCEINRGNAVRSGYEAQLLVRNALFAFPWLRETRSMAAAAA